MSTPESSPIPSPDEFITATDAADMAKVHRRRVLRWAAEGLITTQNLPAGPPRYLRRDVEALLTSSIRPASRVG